MNTTHSTHKVNGIIPDYIQERLDSASEGPGNRHKDIVELAYMLVGERIPDDQIFTLLRQRYPDKDKPDSEIRRAINGAHRRNPQPADTGKSSYRFGRVELDEKNVIEFTVEDKPIPSEIPTVPATTIDFLRQVFQPGETVCIVTQAVSLPESDKLVPANSGTFLTVEEWAELLNESGGTLQSYCNDLAGAWVRVNPMASGDTKGEDKGVSAYRHVLVEFDGKDKLEQWRIFKECGLPLSAVIDSGGKSLHAWVRVDARDAEEFKERQEKVYDYLGRYLDDKGNKNPSRLSRLPGVERAGKMQSVVAFGIGAATWQEWEEWNVNDGLPGYDDWSELCVRDIPKPEVLIDGLLHRGEVLMLSGGAKTNKSWTLAELEIATAAGGTWLGLKCQKGKVLCVDGELSEYFFRDRRQKIAQHRHAVIEPGMWKSLRLRGYVSNIFALADKLIRDCKGKDVSLIVIDPIYTLLGDDVEENSNEDIARVGAEMHRVARETGSAVVFSQHHAKGNQQGKRAIERASGAGSWGRFVDSSIDITAHTETGCFNFEITPRNFPPHPAFVARRMEGFPVWLREDGLKPEAKKGNSAAALTDMLQILEGQELTPGGWKQACEEKLRMASATFDRRKKLAIRLGLVEQKGIGRLIVCKLGDGVIRNGAGEYTKATVFEVKG